MFARLALKSLLDRKGSVLLSLLAMTVSIFVLLGVDHIRHQTKENFSSTISGVDLIVGARSGSLNLLLYSVFRIGSPANNIRWDTYNTIANNKNIKWTIPISLGDSHKGYRVLGTNKNYFKHFSYGKKYPLTFLKGREFNQVFDVVLGAEIAKKLNYEIGDTLTLAHGIASTSFSKHDDYPFIVVGILAATGTPVDQTLHVSLGGIEAIHRNWQHGVKLPNRAGRKQTLEENDLHPKSITAFMLGLESKMATFKVQRSINQYTKEPLLAILPGVALSELWQMMGVVENTLLLVSALVFLAAILGVSAMLLSSLRERQREMQLLRVIGAPPLYLFFLIELEALLITLVSCIFAIGLLTACLVFMSDYLASNFSLYIEKNLFTKGNFQLISIVILASIIIAVVPSLSSYRQARHMQS